MYIALFSVIIIIIDQLSKHFIRVYLSQSQKVPIIGDYFYLTFVKNRGAAFGILEGQRSFFILTTIFFLVFILQKRGNDIYLHAHLRNGTHRAFK